MNFEIENIDNNKNYIQQTLVQWQEKHDWFNKYPWRNTNNQWHALVAEIMLQRTNADQVLPIYQDFTERYPHPEDFINEYTKSKVNPFESLGLKWRNKLLYNLALEISQNGIPDSREDLKKLPGVGNYIASAFLSLHLNKKEAIIDSNIVRLYARLFGFEYDGETRRKKWFRELSEKLLVNHQVKKFNYALLDFSMNICKIKPECNICPLNKICHYYNNFIQK